MLFKLYNFFIIFQIVAGLSSLVQIKKIKIKSTLHFHFQVHRLLIVIFYWATYENKSFPKLIYIIYFISKSFFT